METETLYRPRRMPAVLKDLAARFYLPREFPGRTPDPHTAELLQRAHGLDEAEAKALALSMPSGELDSLLLLLPKATDDEASQVRHILKHRASRRLVDLYWPLYQYDFDNPNVKETAKTILENLVNNDKDTVSAVNLALFIYGDGFDTYFHELDAKAVPLGIFGLQKRLILQSPLGTAFMEQYFSQCRKDGYLLNGKHLLAILDSVTRESADEILKHYLHELDRDEYIFDVNIYILAHWGHPFKSAGWTGFPMALRHKLAEWDSYRLLSEHFKTNKLKLRTLGTVIPYTLHIGLENDNRYMVMNFGEFVIVDDNELSSYSYIIKKSAYEKLSEQIEKFGIDKIKYSIDRVLNARDFIIEEVEDNFMQLDYNEFGKLYILDMLRIMLGVKPDQRPSKSLIRKKRRSGQA